VAHAFSSGVDAPQPATQAIAASGAPDPNMLASRDGILMHAAATARIAR